MKKLVSLFAVVAIMAVSLLGCSSTKDEEVFYYNYDITEYITVGDYDKKVYRGSEDYRVYSESFYDITFGDDFKSEFNDGVVESNDIANISYTGYIDGTAFSGGIGENYDLDLGERRFFVDGFEEGIVGSKIGEKFELGLTMPSDYFDEAFASKAVTFEIVVNYVTRAAMPNENNIKRYGYQTVEEYELAADAYAARLCIFNNICKNVEVDVYPEKEMQALYNDQIDYINQMCTDNNITFQQFLNAEGYTEEEFKAYLTEYEIKEQIKQYLVAYYVLQINDAKLKSSDIEAKRTELKEKYGEDLSGVGYYEINIQQLAAYDKALSLLDGVAEVLD